MQLIDYNAQTKFALFSIHDEAELSQLPTKTTKWKNIGPVCEGSKAVSDSDSSKVYSLTADNEWVEFNQGGTT